MEEHKKLNEDRNEENKRHNRDASVSAQAIQGNEEGSSLSVFTNEAPQVDESGQRLMAFIQKPIL